MNSTPHRWIALLETSPQPYDQFATNALKETVGWAELVHQAGTRFVLEAVRECGGPALLPEPTQPSARALRRRIAAGQDGGMLAWRPMEVIAASAGRAILLADSEARIRKAIQLATLKTLRGAPGLELRGASVGIALESWTPSGVAEALRQAQARRIEARSRIPGPDSRFLRSPLVEPCAVSDWPASTLRSTAEAPQAVPVSLPILRRREAADAGWRRMMALADGLMSESLSQAAQLFERSREIAVIRTVVDGLDQAELALGDPQRVSTAEQALHERRRFMAALEECAELAVRDAAAAAGIRSDVPFAPLVVLGDESTILCDGKRAEALASAYERSWRERVGSPDGPEDGIASRLAPLSARVGVGIIEAGRPHYDAFRLAQDRLSGGIES